jgi:hypothetical protein
VDRDIKSAMKFTVNNCRCSQYRKHPWSEQFKRATYHIRYWRKLREIARQLRNVDDTKYFYKTQAGYPPETDHSTASEVECQHQIRRGIMMIQEELVCQKGVVTTRHNTLAISKVLKSILISWGRKT